MKVIALSGYAFISPSSALGAPGLKCWAGSDEAHLYLGIFSLIESALDFSVPGSDLDCPMHGISW